MVLMVKIVHTQYIDAFYVASYSVILTSDSAKRMREVWLAVLVRESTTQLVMYVFAGYMCQILYSYTDSMEALNFLIECSYIPQLFVMETKVSCYPCQQSVNYNVKC